jgi:tRNA (guanine26-N2/guanine27-N2)-dimethyltransferase
LYTKQVVEGKTLLYVPDITMYAKSGKRVGPWSAPVFYNPNASMTRDISLGVVGVLGSHPNMLDVMCGIGARGLRIAVESDASEVVINDVNPDALELAYRSVEANGVVGKVDVQSVGANALCAAYDYREGFDYVDLDPFGSAAPFVATALLAVKRGGVLGVCSTDAANLCGNRPDALYRLYYARNMYPLGVKEVGLRILIGYVVRVAAGLGIAALPILCYHYGDYFRCHFKLIRALSAAQELVSQIGYLHSCSDTVKYLDSPFCSECKHVFEAGPLWMGHLASRDFLSSVLTELKKVESQSARDAERLLKGVYDEDEVTLPYINIHRFVKGSGVSPPSTQRLIMKLRAQGYKANHTHFDPKAVKTNAPLTELMKAARSIGGKTV